MVDYVNLNYVPSKKDLVVMYYVEETKNNLKKASEEIAKESSIGTWTEVATMSKDLAQRLKPSVFHIDQQNRIIKIAYTEELFEAGNIPQILSAIAGNIFGMKVIDNLRLLDINFPNSILHSHKGPKFGIDGIRELLGIKNRPLLGTIVKPKVGLDEEQHAQVCGQAWLGGLDIVKDDENLTSMKFNQFKRRVSKTLKVRDNIENETGEKKIYMPNITAKLSDMMSRADYVLENGGEYVMLDIVTVGFSALQEIRDYLDERNLVIHAHRAMHAALTRNPQHGLTMLVLAKLMRLIGMDQLHTGTIVGKMEGDRVEVQEINKNLTSQKITGNNIRTLDQDWDSLKPVLPVASGGLSPLHVPELIRLLGKDMVFQFGGGCHGHPDGTLAGAKAIRQAVEASLDGISLEECSVKNSELRRAIDKWS